MPERPERLRLAGRSVRLDSRTHAFRSDIADIRLADLVFASHYVEAIERTCLLPSTMLHAAPFFEARAVSELLLGEGFALLEESGGWAWGWCRHDGYVGYVPAAALGVVRGIASHVVTAPTALVFAAADIKAPVLARWPMGARFAGEADGGFIKTSHGWLHARHATRLDGVATDPIAIAERLLGTPYLWGGRSGGGIDCSGLVQLALALAGRSAPRDSDQQRALGEALPERASLRRGDLVFFPGHVGLMTDGEHMVHANAHWMAVTIEPLGDVIARLIAAGGAEVVIDRRRL